MKTKTVKKSDLVCQWHLVDASVESLGRLAAKIAGWLQGKHKINYVAHLDQGDIVVVINTDRLKVTGNKEDQKVYTHYTGYPSGLRKITLKDQRQKDSRLVVRHAVSGMLPKNKLRDRRLARLKLFKDDKHPYEDKFKK